MKPLKFMLYILLLASITFYAQAKDLPQNPWGSHKSTPLKSQDLSEKLHKNPWQSPTATFQTTPPIDDTSEHLKSKNQKLSHAQQNTHQRIYRKKRQVSRISFTQESPKVQSSDNFSSTQNTNNLKIIDNLAELLSSEKPQTTQQNTDFMIDFNKLMTKNITSDPIPPKLPQHKFGNSEITKHYNQSIDELEKSYKYIKSSPVGEFINFVNDNL